MIKRTAAKRSPLADTKLERLLRKLDFSAETVAEAATEQPRLFFEAAEYRVDKMRQYLQLEMDVARIRADRSLAERKHARDNEQRITEGNLAELLTVNPKVIELQNQLAEAEANNEYAKLLLEAYRHRRDCLSVVERLTGAERAMQKLVDANLEEMRKVRRNLEGKYPGGQG